MKVGRKNAFRIASLLLAIVCVCPIAHGASVTYLGPEPAYMIWKGPASLDGADVDGPWQTACSAIGRAMTAGKGPLGAGVFSSVSCVNPSDSPPPDAPWVIIVHHGEDALSITVRRVLKSMSANSVSHGKTKFLDVSNLDLPPSAKSLSALVSPGIADMISMRLLDTMPAAWWINPAQVRDDDTSIKGGAEVPDVRADRAPDTIVLYRLRLDDQGRLWIPEFVGYGQLKVSRGTPVWSVSPAVGAEVRTTGLWAQQSNGRDGRALEWELATRQKYEPAADIGTTASGNVLRDMLVHGSRVNRLGVRYGFEVLPGETLMKKQKLLGAFCDLQHGPGAGWRLFADKIAKVTADDEGHQVSVSTDRYLIGFALSIVPGRILQRVDVTPRIGFLSMSADLPYGTNPMTGHPVIKSFSATRAGSGGAEAGLEFGDGENALRFWASIDRGVSLMGNSDWTVKASRIGLDVIVPVNKGWIVGETTRLNLLTQLFGFFERIDLGGNDGDEVHYVDAFLGAGLGLTW